MNKKLLFILLLLSIPALLAACSGNETVVETAVSPTISPTATIAIARATAAPTATPVPPVASITISPQTVGEDGVLVVDEVVALEDGWLAIYAKRNGQMGELLAYTAVSQGSNSNTTVAIPPMLATANLTAMLYADVEGEAGFDVKTAVYTHPFTVVLDIPVPTIAITDQTIGEDGIVQFNNIFTTAAGWIVIYSDDNGTIGEPLAHQYVEAGENEEVTIPIPLNKATSRLIAALFVDSGTSRHYEDDTIDTAVLVNGEPVTAAFKVKLPPSIYIYDQPLIDRTLIIDRAVSDGPGWLVAYNDPGTTSAGIIIGSVPLADGLNELISLTISSATVDTVYLLLHSDEEDVGQFNVPGDLPVVMENGRLPTPATIRTNQNSYLITRNQAISQNAAGSSITVPLVAATTPVWLAIHTDVNGEPSGDIIGYLHLPVGLNRNIVVPIELDGVTQTLHAVLHRDDGILKEFEFPDGDPTLQRNFSLIQAPFEIE